MIYAIRLARPERATLIDTGKLCNTPKYSVYPTRAGVLAHNPQSSPALWRLPHACGGVGYFLSLDASRTKFTPRVRGCWDGTRKPAFSTQVYPTRAGVLGASCVRRFPPRVFTPRVRGCWEEDGVIWKTTNVYPTRAGVLGI